MTSTKVRIGAVVAALGAATMLAATAAPNASAANNSGRYNLMVKSSSSPYAYFVNVGRCIKTGGGWRSPGYTVKAGDILRFIPRTESDCTGPNYPAISVSVPRTNLTNFWVTL